MSEYKFCDSKGKLLPKSQKDKYKNTECDNKDCKFQYNNEKGLKCNFWHPCAIKEATLYLGAPCGNIKCEDDHHLEDNINVDVNSDDDDEKYPIEDDGKEEYIPPTIHQKAFGTRACSYYQTDSCNKTDIMCDFVHVKVNSDTKLCYSFHSKNGICNNKSCKHKHFTLPNQPISTMSTSISTTSTPNKPINAASSSKQVAEVAATAAVSTKMIAPKAAAKSAPIAKVPSSSADEIEIALKLSEKEAALELEIKKKEQDDMAAAIKASTQNATMQNATMQNATMQNMTIHVFNGSAIQSPKIQVNEDIADEEEEYAEDEEYDEEYDEEADAEYDVEYDEYIDSKITEKMINMEVKMNETIARMDAKFELFIAKMNSKFELFIAKMYSKST